MFAAVPFAPNYYFPEPPSATWQIEGAYSYIGAVLIVVLVVLLFRRKPVRTHLKNGCCPNCRYDMRATPDSACPECGWRRDGATDE